MTAPEGSVVNCRFPAAVAARMQIGHFMTEIVFNALAAATPRVADALVTASPLLEVLDFLERLAPFSAPDLMVRDERPLWGSEVRLAIADPKAALAGGHDDDDEADEPAAAPTQDTGGFDALGALRGAIGRD